MSSIPERVKSALFHALIREPKLFFPDNSSNTILQFALDIWDLESMPSHDPRFPNALKDTIQHLINNDDWTWEDFFIARLNLLGDEEEDKFIKFLETIVSPKYRASEDDITKFVMLINPYLESNKWELIIDSYDKTSDWPIYKIATRDANYIPVDVRKNDIPIIIYKDVPRWAHKSQNHQTPKEKPALVLVFNHTWNDQGMMTTFELFYYDEKGASQYIGTTRFAVQDPSWVSALKPTILEKLEDKYENYLPDTFCSLGQSDSYYVRLKEALGKRLESALFALRDAAFFTDIREKFQHNPVFTTAVIREPKHERILRQIKYQIYGYDLKNLYKFTYAFQPAYSDGSIDINFEFDNYDDLPNRIYALIGKNGTGKTQFITSLPLNIWKKNNQMFLPKTPLFSKVIAVSYSAFDKFSIPKRTSSFNYIYCGLRNETGEPITDRGQILRFHNTWKKIELSGRINQWRRVLSNFIELRVLDEILVERTDQDAEFAKNSYIVNASNVTNFRNKLSSGQNIMFFIISEIVANIMYDSLLLYDEPETHLHPNAITELMNTIYELVNEFQSYCIIATHSPLIIRELFSRNVYVIERHEDIPSVRRISIECFGENLTTLTEEVFGNKSTPKQYKMIIDRFVQEGRTFDEIVDMLQFDGRPLSLNARIYIKSVINEKP